MTTEEREMVQAMLNEYASRPVEKKPSLAHRIVGKCYEVVGLLSLTAVAVAFIAWIGTLLR